MQTKIANTSLKAPKISKDQYEFLPDVLEITEKPASLAGQLSIWLIFSFVVAALLWSYFGKIDIVATTYGTLVPAGDLKLVQPYEGGIVEEIYVEDGKFVNEGDLLIKLDTGMKTVDYDANVSFLSKYQLEAEILQSILGGKDFSELESKDEDGHLVEYYVSLRKNYYKNVELFNTQLKQSAEAEQTMQLGIFQLEGSLRFDHSRLESLKNEYEQKSVYEQQLEQLKTKYDQLAVHEANMLTLFNNGVIPRSEYDTVKFEFDSILNEIETQNIIISDDKAKKLKEIDDLEAQINSLHSQLAIQQSALAEAQTQTGIIKINRDNFTSEDIKGLNDRLVAIEKEMSGYSAQADKAELNLGYSYLTAPVSGIIHGLKINTLGAVVTNAEALLTIVPAGTELIVESFLLNKDSGFVEMGQEVAVKVQAYPFQKFGTIMGHVTYISPNTYQDEKLGYVYKIEAALDADYLEGDGKEYKITPGMQVTAEIKTGERRIIAFFLEPLVQYLDEGLKVR